MGSPPTRKRTRAATASSRTARLIDLTNDDEDYKEPASAPSKKKQKKGAAPRKSKGEKRKRDFREEPPQGYFARLERALSQRMFVLDRTRQGTDEVPEESIELAGSTGNVYTVLIAKVPKCTCPDKKYGNLCKHLIYVMHQVLKAPDQLVYQNALLSSELRDIFASAPSPTTLTSVKEADPRYPSNRKPIEGDCPICFMEFNATKEEIVYCKAACGNNIHKSCQLQWAKSSSGQVNCVYCRTPWQGDTASATLGSKVGKINKEGYRNVGGELGLPSVRDTSTYRNRRLYEDEEFGELDEDDEDYGRY